MMDKLLVRGLEDTVPGVQWATIPRPPSVYYAVDRTVLSETSAL